MRYYLFYSQYRIYWGPGPKPAFIGLRPWTNLYDIERPRLFLIFETSIIKKKVEYEQPNEGFT